MNPHERAATPPAGPLFPLPVEWSTADPQFATNFVERLLRLAGAARASDVHLTPADDGLRIEWRLDGVLHPLGRLPRAVLPAVVARLKVVAGLLTYETALPQEGRLRDESLAVEVRVSTFPTLFGERVVLRMLQGGEGPLRELSQLGLPPQVLAELERQLAETTGAILLVGPAGSGKTTTAYACLRHVVTTSRGGRSLASLEDPIEVAVAGVAQSQVNPAARFDMATGLRSLLRLDPEVILIGEMRDRATAEIAIQAALTGQLVVTTFHAGGCDDALHRLLDMGILQYAVRNAVRLVVAQRLVRRLCTCATPADPAQEAAPLGLSVAGCRRAVGCDACQGTGYAGRTLLAEWRRIAEWAPFPREPGPTAGRDGREEEGSRPDTSFWAAGETLVEAGVTSPLEVIRALGLRAPGAAGRPGS